MTHAARMAKGWAAIQDDWQRRRDKLLHRAEALGFPTMRAYLKDRRMDKGWTQQEIAVELGTHRARVRALLQEHV
jgi:hypothetical protein